MSYQLEALGECQWLLMPVISQMRCMPKMGKPHGLGSLLHAASCDAASYLMMMSTGMVIILEVRDP